MRKAKSIKRFFQPDFKYNEVLVTRFVNNLMISGKKAIAYKIFYGALDVIAEKNQELSAIEVFKQAVENVTPQVEVKSRRIGGASFQVPIEVPANRKVSIAIKNLIRYSAKRTGKSMVEKLSAELLSAFKQEGGAYKRKEDIHRVAEANKAYAHYRF